MKQISRTIHILIALALLIAILPLSQPVQAQNETLAASVPGFSLLANINPVGDGVIADSTYPLALGNKVFFFGNNGTNGLEPWITDGSIAGTRMVKDTVPGASGIVQDWVGNPIEPAVWNGKAFFASYVTLPQLGAVPTIWISDGTSAGTIPLLNQSLQVKKIVAGSNGVLFLTVFNSGSTHEAKVWFSNGTSQGTYQIYSWSDVYEIIDFDFALFKNFAYVANRYAPGMKLLKIDLSTKKVVAELTNNVMYLYGSANGLLFFLKYSYEEGDALWQTDGTAAGTQMIADLSPGRMDVWISDTLIYGNQLAFTAEFDLGDGPKGVYVTSGKASGLTVLSSISSFESDSFSKLNQALGVLYFSRESNLWYSDGTPEKTSKVCPTCLAFMGSKNMGGFPGKILFGSYEENVGGSIWITDGTDAGTHRLTLGIKEPANMLTMNGYVFFTARSSTSVGYEPWVYYPVDSRMRANLDKVSAPKRIPTKINVLANDQHLDNLPKLLSGYDASSRKGGEITRDDNGTPANLTDDLLVYTGPLNSTVDEFAYWIEDSTGKIEIGRVSVTLTGLPPSAPTNITFVPSMSLAENMYAQANIGSLVVTDPDVGDKHNCVLITYDTPIQKMSDSFVLYTTSSLDYESHPTGYALNVKCTDLANLSLTKTIIVPVANVNEPTVLTFPQDQTVVEDALSTSIISWSDPENDTRSVTVTATRGTARLTNCTYSTCSLEYQPLADFVGQDAITVKATDAGGLVTEKIIKVTVISANDDPPVMKQIPTFVRQNEVKAYQINLERIEAGPYETGPVTITVSTDNPAMLADLAVDYTEGPEGTLSFTLHPEEGTEALVTITLSDGVNQVDYTFKVIVTDNPPLYLPVVGR